MVIRSSNSFNNWRTSLVLPREVMFLAEGMHYTEWFWHLISKVKHPSWRSVAPSLWNALSNFDKMLIRLVSWQCSPTLKFSLCWSIQHQRLSLGLNLPSCDRWIYFDNRLYSDDESLFTKLTCVCPLGCWNSPWEQNWDFAKDEFVNSALLSLHTCSSDISYDAKSHSFIFADDGILLTTPYFETGDGMI